MRTPKQKFIESASKVEFEKIANSAHFEEAVNAALLQMVYELPPPQDPSKGWDGASRIEGAKRVLGILATLHVPEQQATQRPIPNIKPPQ